MRGPYILEIEFKLKPQAQSDFDRQLKVLRNWSAPAPERNVTFTDKADSTSVLWMSEWATRRLLSDFIRGEAVRTALLGISVCCTQDLRCRVIEPRQSGLLVCGARRIRQVPAREFDLNGLLHFGAMSSAAGPAKEGPAGEELR